GTAVALWAVAGVLIILLISVPSAARGLVGASTIYMIFLAWRIATAPPLAEKVVAGGGQPTSWGGFLLAVANPKAYLAIAAVFNGITIVPGSAFCRHCIEDHCAGSDDCSHSPGLPAGRRYVCSGIARPGPLTRH